LSSRLLMLLPPASSTLRAAQQRSLSEPPLRFRIIPKLPVGFRTRVALGAAVPEPSLWEQTRRTTEGSPKGVAPFAGKQMPSNIRRRRRRPFPWGTQRRAFRAKENVFPGSFESQMSRCDPKGFRNRSSHEHFDSREGSNQYTASDLLAHVAPHRIQVTLSICCKSIYYLIINKFWGGSCSPAAVLSKQVNLIDA